MNLAIMQPYLFPYIGYFQLIHLADKFVIYDDVNFIKQGWINRNRILISGKATYFTVPITNGSSFELIKDVAISKNNTVWKRKLLASIEQSYTKASQFNVIFSLLKSVIDHDHQSISQMATASIKAICHYLDITTPIIDTASIYNNNHLYGEDRIVDICLQEKCRTYTNASGGIDLYSRENFEKMNITLQFLQPIECVYNQFNLPFTPWLSIIDVLMHNRKDQAQAFLGNYQLL